MGGRLLAIVAGVAAFFAVPAIALAAPAFVQTVGTQTVTDGLVRLFGMPSPWAQMLRNRGMSVVDAVRPLKRLLAQPALR